jgi:hypothetical protein
MGLAVSGSEQVVVEQLWAHDTGWRGVDAEDDLGPTSLTLRASLIEKAVELGAATIGSTLTVEDSVIRDVAVSSTGVVGGGLRGELSPLGNPATMVLSHSLIERVHHAAVFLLGGAVSVDSSVLRDVAPDGNGFARGVGGEAEQGLVSNLQIERSLIERSQEIGIAALGSLLSVDSTVVRDVATQLNVDGTGRGISVQALPPLRGGLELRNTLVANNHDAAVFLAGADAEITASLVRDTASGAVFFGGRGLTAQSHSMTAEPSAVTVSDSRFERNVEGGIVVVGSSIDVRRVAVRDTLPSADLGLGRGIIVQADALGAPSFGHVESSLVERATETGVFVSSSQLELLTSEVHDTQFGASDFARGLHVQPNAPGGAPIVNVWGSRIGTSRQSGVVVTSADVTIARSLIEDTQVSANAARPFGDAITAVAESGPVILRVSESKVSNSHRAAVASFGATVHLVGSSLNCQAFDLAVEEYYGSPVDLHDEGGNLCGCPEATDECVAISSGLAPPEALAPSAPD